MNTNVFEVAIYYVASSNEPYHLVLEDTKDKSIQLVDIAKSEEELYPKAFEMAHKANKQKLLAFAIKKRNEVEKQEELSRGVGNGFLHRGNKEEAQHYFSRANSFNEQRTILESEILDLMGLRISQASFANPVQL